MKQGSLHNVDGNNGKNFLVNFTRIIFLIASEKKCISAENGALYHMLLESLQVEASCMEYSNDGYQ